MPVNTWQESCLALYAELADTVKDAAKDVFEDRADTTTGVWRHSTIPHAFVFVDAAIPQVTPVTAHAWNLLTYQWIPHHLPPMSDRFRQLGMTDSLDYVSVPNERILEIAGVTPADLYYGARIRPIESLPSVGFYAAAQIHHEHEKPVVLVDLASHFGRFSVQGFHGITADRQFANDLAAQTRFFQESYILGFTFMFASATAANSWHKTLQQHVSHINFMQ